MAGDKFLSLATAGPRWLPVPDVRAVADLMPAGVSADRRAEAGARPRVRADEPVDPAVLSAYDERADALFSRQ